MSKLKLCLVTFGTIIGIVGILHGSAELLKGSILVSGHTIEALPINWPNQVFYEIMQGAPGFSLLTGIPYYVVGLLAISVSIALIVCSVTVIDVSKSGISIFAILSLGIFCFGAGRGTPVVISIPLIVVSIMALWLPSKDRSHSSKRRLSLLFNLFYWWHILSWLLFFPGLFTLSFYQDIPTFLFIFMFASMPIATLGSLVTGLKFDKSH